MLATVVAIVILGCMVYLQRKCSYWRRVGNVKGPRPWPLIGNMYEQLVGKKHYGRIFADLYRAYPTTAWVGIYELFNKPAVLVRDLELVKDVLVGSFQHFNANTFTVDEKIDPLMAMNPFTQTGDKWKMRRSQIVPVFSTTKVRSTFPIVKNIADNFVAYVTNNRVQNPDFDAKEICYRYTVDVVASCAFGIDAESFTNPNAKFRQMGGDLFSPYSFQTWIRTMFALFAPQMALVFKVPFVPSYIDHWYRDLVTEVIRQRKRNDVKVNDLFQIMYDILSQNGTIEIKNNEIVGHSVTFLTEGSETSSILMSYLLFELAMNPDIQDRVQDEIDRVLKECGGELTDEAVQKLDYLERVMYETLRLHPAVYTVSRKCTKDYVLPLQYTGAKPQIVMREGMAAIIPVEAIHYDPEIYPDPHQFDPDRFLEENKDARHRYAFLGFGEGPRICLGMKFGLHQSKIGIASLLSKYRVRLSEKQKLPLQVATKAFLMAPKDGILVQFLDR